MSGNEQYVTVDQLNASMAALGETITTGIVGQLNENAIRKEKKLSEIAQLKKERSEAIQAIRIEADEAIKEVDKHFAPRLKELEDQAFAKVETNFESAGKKVGRVIGIGLKPLNALKKGVAAEAI
jgi:tetrahydromethanopterin S-methyltransferase subunit G